MKGYGLSSTFLLLTAFIAGFATMAVEMVGFRIFAPHFGFSVYVSGTLIGLIMVALAVGAWWGGRLADQKNDYTTLFGWLAAATVYLFISMLTYNYVLTFFAEWFIWGVVASAIILYGFPMVVLSMVSPYLVKLHARTNDVGKAAGDIGAVGTIGAILGTFTPTFLLIPTIGSFKTYFLANVTVLLVVLYYFVRTKKAALLGLLLLATIVFEPTYAHDDIIYAAESPYNLVRVHEGVDGTLKLLLNDDMAYHSRYNEKKKIDETAYYYSMNVGPLINNGKEVLVLGMGAGTSPYQMAQLLDVHIDAVEIDPVVVEAAKQYFDLDTISDRLTIHVDDARPYLRKTEKQYDVVEIDMYHGGPYTPFYVLTQEFFEEVKAVMNEDGVVMMNVLRPRGSENNDVVFHHIGNTINTVFENVFYLDLDAFNVIVFATDEIVSVDEIKQRIMGRAPEDFRYTPSIVSKMHPYSYQSDVNILTDDLAPVDRLTYKMLKGYLDAQK